MRFTVARSAGKARAGRGRVHAVEVDRFGLMAGITMCGRDVRGFDVPVNWRDGKDFLLVASGHCSSCRQSIWTHVDSGRKLENLQPSGTPEDVEYPPLDLDERFPFLGELLARSGAPPASSGARSAG